MARPGRGGRREKRELLHVVCEGEGERVWFQLLAERLNAGPGVGAGPEVKVERGKKGDALVRFRKAEADRRRTGRTGPWWVVTDTEPHDPAKHAKVWEAVDAAAEEDGCRLVLSHACFEVWLFCLLPGGRRVPNLHDAETHRRALSSASEGAGWPPYDRKTDRAWLGRTLDRLGFGVAAAKALRGSREKLRDPIGEDPPFSEVPGLVEDLQEALSGRRPG